MGGFARMLLGLAMLPACCGLATAFWDSLVSAAGNTEGISVEAVSLIGGIASFALAWMALSHPVKTYVLGHELTHALWGLLFGAKPSDVRVSSSGGSVRLTKSNFIITLAPYFFPFYTFVVIVAALITYAFLRPLPCLPLWMFMIGFTWAFHVLFTLETLQQRQPDIRLYGRFFSWTFIFIANVVIVLVSLAATTDLTFSSVASSALKRVGCSYAWVGRMLWSFFSWIWYNIYHETS